MPAWGTFTVVDLDAKIAELAPRVLRYAAAQLGDTGLAEEVAQDSLAALVRRCRNGGPPDSAEAFVFAVARRRVGRALWRRRLWVPLERAVGAQDCAPTPEANLIADAEKDLMKCALARLGWRDREAILMVAAGELSMREAAAAQGLSVSAVKMRISRARSRLRSLLEEKHDRRIDT